MQELLNKQVTIFCAVYIYTGELIAVTDTYAKLKGAKIVYETGPLDTPDWGNAQPDGGIREWYVQLSMVESFGVLK